MTREIIEVSIDNLVKADWNYKTDASEELLNKLINSVEYQKSLGLIAVREIGGGKYEVIDGNHRLDAAKKLGLTKLKAENFGSISKAEAIVISKQRNSIWIEDDDVKFAEVMASDVLKEFQIDELKDMLPLNEKELEAYAGLLDFSWENFESAGEPAVRDNTKASLTFNLDEYGISLWRKAYQIITETTGLKNADDVFVFIIKKFIESENN